MKISIIIIVFLFWLANIALAQDSNGEGILRIQTDIDDAVLTVDGKAVIADSYGNKLFKDGSFILLLSPGNHQLIFTADNYEPIDTNIVITKDEILPINIQFVIDKADEPIINKVNLKITSQPEGIHIIVKNYPDTMITPASVSLMPGTLSFEAFLDGYESLITSYELASKDNISLEFLLKTKKPEKLTILDAGLELKPILTKRSEAEANVVRSKLNSFAELFTIFPLSQGILAKLILDSDYDDEADILIITGATLSLGSYLIGKVLYKKRLKSVRKYNESIEIDNQLAKDFNTDMENSIKTQNAENLQKWKLENEDKGKIRIVEE